MRTLRNTEIDNTRSSLTARTKSKRRNQEFRRGLPQTKAEVQMFFVEVVAAKGTQPAGDEEAGL